MQAPLESARPTSLVRDLIHAPAPHGEPASLLGAARRRLAPVLLLALFVSSCRSTESTAWNLRELHSDDASVAITGRVMGPISFNFRRIFGSITSGMLPESAPQRPISEPRRKVLRELMSLADQPAVTGRDAGLQVELATWLGLNETAPVARAMCVRMLVSAAERLDVGPEWAALPQSTSGPGDVAVQLRPLLDSNGPEELRTALESLDSMALDVEGARRVLRGLNELVRQPSQFAGMSALVRSRHEELQSRCTALALILASEDPSDQVRAVALPVRLNWYPESQQQVLLDCLEEVRLESLAVLLEHIAQNGLPVGEDSGDAFEVWLDLLVRCTDLGYGPVVVSSLRALDRATRDLPSELDLESAPPRGTLRAEDWFLWLRTRRTRAMTPIG